MINEKQKQIIKRAIITACFLILTIVVGSIMYKYEIEGETNMPFELTKITIVSSAEGVADEEDKLKLKIEQNNDIYLQIEKNLEIQKENKIKKITIGNLKIINPPRIGVTEFYAPSSNAREVFANIEEAKTTEIEFFGKEKSDIKKLEIGNQRGIVGIRFSILELGEVVIEEEISHDGTMLSKKDIVMEDLQCTISFDLLIELETKVIFKAPLTFELPVGNLLREGVVKKEITQMDGIIFKRV